VRKIGLLVEDDRCELCEAITKALTDMARRYAEEKGLSVQFTYLPAYGCVRFAQQFTS
jgi:hypothetical protein